MASPYVLEGEGPFQRFIVRYRDGSAPAGDASKVQGRLVRTMEGAALGARPALTWERRLAVKVDVFTTDRPLDRSEAQALMQAFSADPDVEYIEIDGRVGIGPGPLRPRSGD